MKTIDARRQKEDDYYTMDGICGNCASRFAVSFSVGEKTRPMHKCPDCGVLAQFTLGKKADGMRWTQVPNGMRFACPGCLSYKEQLCGIDVNAKPSEGLILCPQCQEEQHNENSGSQD